jgi:hypothetical protein
MARLRRIPRSVLCACYGVNGALFTRITVRELGWANYASRVVAQRVTQLQEQTKHFSGEPSGTGTKLQSLQTALYTPSHENAHNFWKLQHKNLVSSGTMSQTFSYVGLRTSQVLIHSVTSQVSISYSPII